MLAKILILVALAFLALGALRFATAAPRPRWVIPAVVGVAVSAVLWRFGLVGVAGGVAAAGLAWLLGGSAGPSSLTGGALSEAEARDLLGLGLNAGEEEIRAAHRSRITRAHPDKGGDPHLAARLNAARDLLIKAQRRR